MDRVILNLVQNGISLEALVLIVQFVVAAFIVLAIKSWVEKTWAWHKFKKSTVVSIGTVVTIPLNGVDSMRGRIVGADKTHITIQDGNNTAYKKTTQFVKDSIVVHNRQVTPKEAKE